MTNHLLIVNFAAAALILARALYALNRMTSSRRHHIDRLFCSLVATGAGAILLGPLFGQMLRPTLFSVLLNVGIAGLYVLPWLRTTIRHRLKGKDRWTSR